MPESARVFRAGEQANGFLIAVPRPSCHRSRDSLGHRRAMFSLVHISFLLRISFGIARSRSMAAPWQSWNAASWQSWSAVPVQSWSTWSSRGARQSSSEPSSQGCSISPACPEPLIMIRVPGGFICTFGWAVGQAGQIYILHASTSSFKGMSDLTHIPVGWASGPSLFRSGVSWNSYHLHSLQWVTPTWGPDDLT